MLRKNVHYEWHPGWQAAFEALKNVLWSNGVLAYPDFENEFVVYTDASKYALGTVLNNADRRPVHLASRALKDAEIRYAVVEKKLLTLVFATKVFRPFLLGRHITLRTDRAPLKWLFNMTDPSSRLTKFRLQLDEYDFTVKYIQGKKNGAADALLRKDTVQLALTADEVSNWRLPLGMLYGHD